MPSVYLGVFIAFISACLLYRATDQRDWLNTYVGGNAIRVLAVLLILGLLISVGSYFF
jgi:hypothetical protein